MTQENAYRTLVRAYGCTLVNKLMPIVADRGFAGICEIPAEGDWTAEGAELTIFPCSNWRPMFQLDEGPIWNAAAGYVRPEVSPILTHELNISLGQFLAGYLAAKCKGKVYSDGETSETLYLKQFIN